MISVVIPCYNAAEYISETFQSIVEQGVDDLEIIMVDDGSTDDSARIIKTIQDPRLIYIHQENKGVSAARNKGLKAAKGAYIIFFDADDKMAPHFLSKRKEVLDASPQIAFCCGPVVTFPKEGKKTFGTATDVAGDLLLYRPLYSSCPSNYLIRKSVLSAYGISFNENLSSTADRFFLLQLAAKTKGGLIDDAPLLYRVSPDSMSNKLTSKLILDNERYLIELRQCNLVPERLEKEFMFKIQYILGLGFIKIGNYQKGLKYTASAFFKNPLKFINQII